MNTKKEHELKRDEEVYQGNPGGGRPYTGATSTNYTPPRSSTYWAIRVGLVILGFAIGIIVSNL